MSATSMSSTESRPEAAAVVLFCPFCREPFEGEARCPDHDLELVPFERLPRSRRALRWDERLHALEPRHGRGLLAAGALALVAAFFSPMVVVEIADRAPRLFTGFEMANGRAMSVWALPFVAIVVASVLYRRRTLLEMRGSRLALLVLSLAPAGSFAYALRHIRRGVEQTHGAMRMELGAGVLVLGIATVLLVVGALRFGAAPLPPRPRAGEPASKPPIEPG